MDLLDDGERKDRIILSGIHEYYKPEELVGKTCIAIVNLPPRKMMGIGSVSEKTAVCIELTSFDAENSAERKKLHNQQNEWAVLNGIAHF